MATRTRCSKCQVHDGCGPTGEVIYNFCCKCLPQSICVKLYADTNYCNLTTYSAAEPIMGVDAWWWKPGVGCARRYQGELECPNPTAAPIDFDITFWKDPDTDECWICLQSDELGYDLVAPGDESEKGTRVCLPMGGAEFDPAVKLTQCSEMTFTFPVTVYGSPGTITIEPSDTTEDVKREHAELCLFKRVCVETWDGYEQTTDVVCWDRENNRYQFYVGGDETKQVTIDTDNTVDPPLLTLTSWLGDGDQVEAECPGMFARWDITETGDPWLEPSGDPPRWIKIRGDRQAKCTDCKCYCRCLCITYVSNEGEYERGIACEQRSYDGCDRYWSVLLADREIIIWMECEGCPNPATKLRLVPPTGTSLVSESYQSVVCPDLVEALWTIDTGGGNTAAISVECLMCNDKCELIGTSVPCCPERATDIPYILHATIESGCTPLVGLEFPLHNGGPVIGQISCWEGTSDAGVGWTPPSPGDTCELNLAIGCYNDGVDDYWYASNAVGGCSTLSETTGIKGTLISCDPLEIEFVIIPEGCCNDANYDYGIDGTYTVRITE
jgi:hypothetical protein